MTIRGWITIAAVACLVTNGPAASARAAAGPVPGAGGGAEWFSGPGGQGGAVLHGHVSISGERASLALGGLRFDDRDAGAGAGPLASAALRVADALVVRGSVARYLGDRGLRALRVRGGPEWSLPRGRKLAATLTYLESNLAGVSRGASAELATPLGDRWTGRLSGGLEGASRSRASLAGAVGLSWRPSLRLECYADAGFAEGPRTAASPSSSFPRGPPRGPLGLPLELGTGAAPRTEGEAAASPRAGPTLALGLTLTLP